MSIKFWRQRRLLYFIIAALVISGAVFYFLQSSFQDSPVLEIRGTVSNEIYGRWPIEKGEEFAIEFIHSVNQSPVRETFVIEENMIRLHSLRFYSFGAGIPDRLEEGWEMSRDGEPGQPGAAFVITGFDTSFRELNFIVGTVSDHLLLLGDETISLRDLCGRNAHITIRVR